MNDLKDTLSKALVFENKLDRSNGNLIESHPTTISWHNSFKDLEAISDKVDPFEHGVHYDLGVRTLINGISELWIVRGTKDNNTKIDNCTATIGWNENGHEKLLKYREILIKVLGQPSEEMNNHKNYSEAANSWGPFNSWEFGNTKLILWGSDFRGSMWYKIDFKNES